MFQQELIITMSADQHGAYANYQSWSKKVSFTFSSKDVSGTSVRMNVEVDRDVVEEMLETIGKRIKDHKLEEALEDGALLNSEDTKE